VIALRYTISLANLPPVDDEDVVGLLREAVGT
jgi:hypothetical protein